MISAATKIPAIVGVLRRVFEVGVLEGLAIVDVLDAVTGTDVKTVEVAASGEDVESGKDATANVLTITVAKEVKPGGVTVVWSARTPATFGAIE